MIPTGLILGHLADEIKISKIQQMQKITDRKLTFAETIKQKLNQNNFPDTKLAISMKAVKDIPKQEYVCTERHNWTNKYNPQLEILNYTYK